MISYNPPTNKTAIYNLPAVCEPPAPLRVAGELGLGAGGAVRLAARHRALGQIQGHGERDEVSGMLTLLMNS